MPEPTSLQLITTSEQWQITGRLWQLYLHDLSEFRGSMPDREGLYNTARLRTFSEDRDRCGYLIYSNQSPAGFALLRGILTEPRVMGEFFVVRAARRRHVGQDAAARVLRLHPGKWEIPFQEVNAGAARFWRQVAEKAAAGGYEEQRRPVPGKPAIPADTWLILRSAA